MDVGEAAMVLMKVEMDVACLSEKLCNLNVFFMNVATRESDLEVSFSVKEEIPDEKGVEFYLLCGILDSEVKELDNFFCLVHKEIVGVREVILVNSSELMEDDFKLFEEKLQDCEDSLNQSQEQLNDMKMQSADLRKSLPFFGNYEQSDRAQDAHVSGRNQYLDDKMPLETGEQQRNVLRLLEKSLARELDLDVMLNEARQIEEDLKFKLYISHQEASYLEEEATIIWAQYLEAESVAVILMGISKDLLCQMQIFQFQLNCLTHNRDQLRSNLEDLTMQLEEKIAEINFLNTEIIRHKENIEDFEEKLCAANSRAETAESKCKLLEETNSKLNEELNHLKDNEEVSFLRNRVEVLEASVHETNEIKIESAKNIEIRAKVITNLVMQLAIERARLHEQSLSLAKENRALVIRLQTANKGLSGAEYLGKQDCARNSHSAHESYSANRDKGCGEEIIKFTSTSSEMRNGTSMSRWRAEAGNARSISELESVRTLDAGALNIKHFIVALVVMVISVVAYSFPNSNSPL